MFAEMRSSQRPPGLLWVAILGFRESRAACDMRSARRHEIVLMSATLFSPMNNLSQTLATLEHRSTFDSWPVLATATV